VVKKQKKIYLYKNKKEKMTFLTKILSGIIGLLIIISVGLWVKINSLNKELQDSKDSLLVFNQNNKAFEDLLKQKADSLQNYAVFVANLKNKYKSLENKYSILESEYNILIDSIEVLNGIAQGFIKGEKVIVEFKGKKSKAMYNGSTTFDLKTKDASHSLNLYFDPISIKSLIYLDNNDIIKNLIYADGQLITLAKTEIDSNIYLRIKKEIENISNDNQYKPGFFDKLSIYINTYGIFNINTTEKEVNKIVNFELFNLLTGIQYEFENGLSCYYSKNIINGDNIVGIKYKKSVKQIFNNIF